jgi:hypothetical protein
MSEPILRYGRLHCPQCGRILVKDVVRYPVIDNGIFLSKEGKMHIEITLECPKCKWSKTDKEIV